MKFICPIVLAGLFPFIVERNHDGDTFTGLVETRPDLYERVTVRLDCLYAPELKQDGGLEAKARLAAFLDGGVMLETRWKREKYGRLLGQPVKGDAGYCRPPLLPARWATEGP